jgi:predicted GNAT family N-acyltransferase
MFHVAESEDDLRKVMAVRAIVFCEEQSVPYDIEIDEFEDSSIHILGQLKDEPIASGRLRFVKDYAKIERLAVRKAYRRQGYGELLLKYMLDLAREQRFSKFKLHAQVVTESFYLKHGFKREGEEFLEADIAHRVMLKHDS